MGQCSTELVNAHVFALSDGADGLVQFFVSDANAGALANLQLQVFQNQTIQNLLLQCFGRRYARPALGDGLLNLTNTLVHLAFHDHVVVDDGHDTVQRLNRCMHRTAQE